MDRWKAEMGRVREEKSRRKKIKKRKSPKKQDPGARKGRKHYVFPMVCGSGGLKSRLAKAAGAEPAGQMRDEKLHAVVARSKFLSQHVQNTPTSDHFWKLWYRKSARRCCAKQISKSKRTKHLSFGALLGVARDLCTWSKVSKAWGFCSSFKNDGRRGKRICKDVFRVAGAVQETCSSELFRGQGADFLRRVAFWSIRSSALLRWFCVTGAALRMTLHHFTF